ncbi:MAG: hypothetical protein RIS47_1535 [Bacteroidota bacterium]|jgi:protein TonB
MTKTLFLIFFTAFLFSKAEAKAQYNLGKDSLYIIVDQMPEFKGGSKVFEQYIRENLRYPEGASRVGFVAKVFVKFVIDLTGAISSPEVIRTTYRISPGSDVGNSPLVDSYIQSVEQESMRLMRLCPIWNPGENKGKKVSVTSSVTFIFEPKN